MLAIAQITDLHITDDLAPADRDRNQAGLRAVLAAIHALQPRPDLVIATGDLVNRGDPSEYANLATELARCEIPIRIGIGNHDSRDAMASLTPEGLFARDPDGFVQYGVDLAGFRILMLDTKAAEGDAGDFCEARAARLARALAAQPDTPTLIALHHPPILSGVAAMDPAPDSPWIARLQAIGEAHDNIVGWVCGHMHRAIVRPFGGSVLMTAPATCVQLRLDRRPIADGGPARPQIGDDPPGFALHVWDGAVLTSHVCAAPLTA